MRIGSIGSLGISTYNSAMGLSDFSYQGDMATGAAGAVGAAEKADAGAKPGFRSSPENCETCRERKYVDGSDENVSFKSATHISPNAAAGAVRAHEGEHVANAYSKAAENGGKVLNCSVSIHTAICPECGRSYVSGGTTNTMIRYGDESNPYQKNLKSRDAARLIGGKIDYGV